MSKQVSAPPKGAPKSLFDKVWDAHQVVPETEDHPGLLYIDLHLIHEVTSPQAFAALDERGLNVRRPDRTIATFDHSIPTLPFGPDGEPAYATPAARDQVRTLEQNCADHGIKLFGWDSPHRGIVHVIGPEMGYTQPGMTVVCGDSHTSTHGAFGALAFGIGTTEVSHVLATQCLLQRRPKRMRVTVSGTRHAGVTAKDMILAVIAKIGAGGGAGYVLEYAGDAVRMLSMEERMTMCNMSIEAGARAGMIAPDEVTCAWLQGRPQVPKGEAFEHAAQRWMALAGDDGAEFEAEIHLPAERLAPMITYGTSPDAAVAVDAPIPSPTTHAARRALTYMQVEPGKPMTGMPVDTVFLGSCTNSRLPDLRAAAELMRGRKVAPGVRMLVVPGSEQTRRQAEAEGLHKVFQQAGAEWRFAGCSMCIAMNGDQVAPGKLAVSTSNRNFEGRQGKGARTVLASPLTAAASAVAGTVADPRPMMEGRHVA